MGRRRRSSREKSWRCRRCACCRMARCWRLLRRMGRCTGFLRAAGRLRWCLIRRRRRRSRSICGTWLWAKAGEVYVAAGAPAVVYRVPAGGGKAEVLFKTADQHIRCLLMGPDGTLWAGSDGSGVIYRFATGTAGAKPFAAYAAPRREITSLAMDAAGNVYAAGVGTGRTIAAASAGDGECGGDDYVFAAGVFDGGGGEYAGAGWERDLQDCGGWELRRSW